MSEHKFPTEMVSIPSGGKYYPEDSPFRSGMVELKYMTAKEEDILTSTNLIQNGTVFDKLLENLLIVDGASHTDLLSGDVNAVLLATRILAYGKSYDASVLCEMCEKQYDATFDLTSFEAKHISDQPNSDGEFELKLPSGTMVKIKLLTHGEETAITKEVESISKKLGGSINRELSTRLRYTVKEIDGNRDPLFIAKTVDNFIVRDSRAIRKYYRDVNPEMDMKTSSTCSFCGHSQEGVLPIGLNFFWPDLEV